MKYLSEILWSKSNHSTANKILRELSAKSQGNHLSQHQDPWNGSISKVNPSSNCTFVNVKYIFSLNLFIYRHRYIYNAASGKVSWAGKELPTDQPQNLVQQHISCHLSIYSHPALWACLFSFPKVVVAGGKALIFRLRCPRGWPFLQRAEAADTFQGTKSFGNSRLLCPLPHQSPSAELHTRVEQRSVN